MKLGDQEYIKWRSRFCELYLDALICCARSNLTSTALSDFHDFLKFPHWTYINVTVLLLMNIK